MIEDTLVKIALQIPNMAALVIVVAFFLRVLSRWIETLSGISDRCHEHNRKLSLDFKECVDKNTEALSRMHEQSGQMIELLKKVNGKH